MSMKFKPGDIVHFPNYPEIGLATIKSERWELSRGDDPAYDVVLENGEDAWDFESSMELYELANTPLWKALS